MATFSVNQVKHLYVVKKAADCVPDKDQDKALFFKLKDVNGEAIRTDLITNVMRATATTAEAMQRKLKTFKVALTDADCVAGQDYILRVNYRKFISISDEDTYLEVGMARATATGTIDTTTGKNASNLMKELAKNLYANTRKQGLVDVKVIVSATEKAVPSIAAGDTVTAIIIREIEQPWKLGTRQEEAVDFTVSAPSIVNNTMDYDWATITDETANQTTVLGNGKKVADMEYFYMGERGDIYRKMGYPNVVDTEYMVDPSQQYDLIDIHYAYVGDNHAIQKSEKDLTLVMPAGTVASPDHTVAAAVLTAINALNIVTIVEPDEWNPEE